MSGRPDCRGDDRLGLALHREGWHWLGLDRVAYPTERTIGREHLPRSRPAHDTGRQVHGVTGDREDASVTEPDLVREDEHSSGVHADSEPDGRADRVGCHDTVHGAEHTLCVVAAQDRHSSEDDDLAAVGPDVGAMEAGTVAL